jgi:hypothetical protein
MNKAIAGFHILSILSVVDNDFVQLGGMFPLLVLGPRSAER